jgi:hypothetical protein
MAQTLIANYTVHEDTQLVLQVRSLLGGKSWDLAVKLLIRGKECSL